MSQAKNCFKKGFIAIELKKVLKPIIQLSYTASK